MPTFRPGFAHPFDELRDELDRLWTTLTTAPPLHGWGVRPRSGEFPAVNMAESPDCITVEAEVPGLDVGDVDVAVAGDELILKGARRGCDAAETTAKGANPGVSPGIVASGTGGFERRLTLPVAVDADRVEARLVDGVLTITCPKSPEQQPRKVSVRAG